MGRLSEDGITPHHTRDFIDGPDPLKMEDHFDSNSVMERVLPRITYQGMGRSAEVATGRKDAEWLHCIAHSLGGADGPTNIMAGPHSLNTLMIAFEHTMASLYVQGSPVRYAVRFIAAPILKNGERWVHTVSLSLTRNDGRVGTPFEFTFTDPYPNDDVPDNFYLEHDFYYSIEELVENWCRDNGVLV